MSMSERWFFYQNTANLWKWARLDMLGTVLGCSGEAHAAREDCVEDARRCGFREPLPLHDFGPFAADHANPAPPAPTPRF
ncbi:MAG TPA: hypothetical protein VM164_01345 [Burkholderiales bacterium]|nr:hypothetical protein [Burkholderiales bacterium]